MEKKYYDVPQEVIDIILDYYNHNDLKAQYVKQPFGYKKAVKSGLIALKRRGEFWNKVYALYPELENVKVAYNADTCKLWTTHAPTEPEKGAE